MGAHDQAVKCNSRGEEKGQALLQAPKMCRAHPRLVTKEKAGCQHMLAWKEFSLQYDGKKALLLSFFTIFFLGSERRGRPGGTSAMAGLTTGGQMRAFRQ